MTLTRNLNARLTRLKAERAALLKNFTAQHPEVMSKDDQISQIEVELEWVKSGALASQRPRSLLTATDSGIAQLEGQVQANALEIENLSREAAQQTATIVEDQQRLDAVPTRDQQLAGMSRESQELNADIADLLKNQQESRPSAMTCCFFSSLKTLLTLTEGNPHVMLNVLASAPLAGFG